MNILLATITLLTLLSFTSLASCAPWGNEWSYSKSVDDNGKITFPAIHNGAKGSIMIGTNAYSADFNIDNAGNVQFLDSDAGGIIIANAVKAGHLCIGTFPATNPIIITNKMGSV